MGATIISLSDRLASAAAVNPAIPVITTASDLSRSVSRIGSHLEIAAMRARKAGDVDGSTFLWRIAQFAGEVAGDAERLERKYRKAKKKAGKAMKGH